MFYLYCSDFLFYLDKIKFNSYNNKQPTHDYVIAEQITFWHNKDILSISIKKMYTSPKLNSKLFYTFVTCTLNTFVLIKVKR